MSSFLEYAEDTIITIPNTIQTEECTLYVINVKIKDVYWNVTHRYNEFLELHEVLQSDHGVAKNLLPPKKLRNKQPTFIEKRRIALECYLNTVLRYLQKTMPRELALFLKMHEFDIMFILQDLALLYYSQGDSKLMKHTCETFTPLQLYAISWRTKQPCPSLEINDQKYNFSHILDFCSQLQEILIKGNDSPLKTSNIIPNELTFDLNVFRNLEKLTVVEANFESFNEIGTLKETLQVLNVNHCSLKSLSSVLMCDNIHKSLKNIEEFSKWTKLMELNVNNTKLTELDDSIKLCPGLKSLNLENNNLTNIQFLENSKRLKTLNISLNKIQSLYSLETKLLVIRILDLSQNLISSLAGFTKLVSLETLDLKFNLISTINEINYLTKLPLLENLILTGNPLSVIVDYRIKVLELFGSRANEISLDNEKSTQKEMDKVAVLQAIRRAKEHKIS